MNHSKKRTTGVGEVVEQMVKSLRNEGFISEIAQVCPWRRLFTQISNFVRRECELIGSWPATLQLVCNLAALDKLAMTNIGRELLNCILGPLGLLV